jgi:hypothetical protein
VLVDAMRGRFHTWTRIRINLQHVPEGERPPQEALDPDDAPNDWAEWAARHAGDPDPTSSSAPRGRPRKPSRARKPA